MTLTRHALGASSIRRPPLIDGGTGSGLVSSFKAHSSHRLGAVTLPSATGRSRWTDIRDVRVEEYASAILTANARWAERLNQTFPQYFPDPQKGQQPKLLWLGCSDSRVQESDATTVLPGTIFVHRNIANQFHLHDESVLSVLAFALGELGVQHIAIVGHDHCGGAIAAMKAARESPPDTPHHHHKLQESFHHVVEALEGGVRDAPPKEPSDTLMQWLTPLIARVRGLLPVLPPEEGAALRRVVEENVRMQVENVPRAWVRKAAKGRPVWVHGWVYDISTGVIRDLKVTKEIGVEEE